MTPTPSQLAAAEKIDMARYEYPEFDADGDPICRKCGHPYSLICGEEKDATPLCDTCAHDDIELIPALVAQRDHARIAIHGWQVRAESAEAQRDEARRQRDEAIKACGHYKRALHELTSEAAIAYEEGGDRALASAKSTKGAV